MITLQESSRASLAELTSFLGPLPTVIVGTPELISW